MSAAACPAQGLPGTLAAARLACEVAAMQEDLTSARSSNEKLLQELAESREVHRPIA